MRSPASTASRKIRAATTPCLDPTAHNPRGGDPCLNPASQPDRVKV